MTDDVLRRFDAFTAAVRARLTMGADAYSDRPAAVRPMPELAREIQDELADVAGWGACLWTRLESLRSRLSELEPTPAARPPEASATAIRMVGADRSG